MGGRVGGGGVGAGGGGGAGAGGRAILFDGGADVVKSEPLEGDPFRGLGACLGVQTTTPPPFELDNRGKRSMALNLRAEEGLEIALRLVDGADVFVTNMRPGAIKRLGLDHESVRRRNPRLVYAHITGYGLHTPDDDRPA